MITLFRFTENNNYKGDFDTSVKLTTTCSTASLADYAYVRDTGSCWYWNCASGTPAWVNQEITEAAYNALDATQKAAVPYIVGV